MLDIRPADTTLAELFLRRLDLTLRAPDALHLAIASRRNATLATFDTKLALAVTPLGVELAHL